MKTDLTGVSECLTHFPGAVLEVTREGVVSDSNGKLEARVGTRVVGRPLAELLEDGSRAKWREVVQGPLAAPQRIELAFDEGATFRLRAFVVVPDPSRPGRLWLLEQPAELSEAPVYEEISALNQELAGAHRELARERARLERALTAEAEAREGAETSRRLVTLLEGIGEAALAQTELDPLLADVLGRVREGLRVDVAVVLFLDEDGRELQVRARQGLPDGEWMTVVAVGDGLAGRIAAARQAMVAEDLSTASFVNPMARAMLRSLAGAPMIVEDRLLGVLEVGTLQPRRFAPEEVSLLRVAAERLASAVERHRLWEAERAARAAAQAAVRQRDEVLAIVAHDLRNPLNRILMATGVLSDSLAPGADTKPVAILKRAVQGMDRLIRDLLDVSRLEAGGLRLERAAVPVAALLSELCEQFEGAARAKGVRLECACATDVDRVLADRGRVFQALSNLVDNALRLTPAGGAVTVGASRSREYVELAVEDTGPGIPADQLPHLFDRFWQGTRERRGSAGLGLAIVKGIVEAHGGRVFVHSTVGQGTTFRFWIPAAA